MNTTTETYTPKPLWEPPKVDSFTAELVGLQDALTAPSEQLERDIATSLAEVAELYIPSASGDSPFYRADKASEYGRGNCMASTEVVVAMGQLLGLDMMVSWDRAHASALYIGSTAIWEVDGYLRKAGDWLKEEGLSDTAEPLVRNLHADQQGAFIYRNYPSTRQQPKVKKTPAQLGDTYYPVGHSQRYNLVLPVEQGINFFGAMGDLRRYSETNYERYRALANEIGNYIPKEEKPEY